MSVDGFIYEHHRMLALLLLALAFIAVGLLKFRAAQLVGTAKPESEKEAEL